MSVTNVEVQDRSLVFTKPLPLEIGICFADIREQHTIDKAKPRAIGGRKATGPRSDSRVT